MDNIRAALDDLKAATEQAKKAAAGVAALMADGESIDDILRHDKGHDDWHAMHGDPPCKSEDDCARMRANYQKGDVSGHAFHGNQWSGGSAPGKNADSQSKADYHNARADHHAAVANELQSKIDSEYKTQGMAAARLDPKVGQLVEARDANQLASSTNRDVAFTYGEHASTSDPKTRAEADLNASKYANKYTRAADIINTQAGGN